MTPSAYTPDPVANRTCLRMTACVGLALALAACGKTEKIPTTTERLASVQQKQETTPDFYVPRKTVDYMSDLKNIKDAPKEVPKAPERASAPAPAPAPVAAAPTPAPVAAIPVKTAPAPAPVVAQPAASAPASNVVASAAPTARPAAPAPSTAVTVLSREQPDFPREAVRAGVESGTVRARLTIGPAGDVTNVAIVQAQPARVFDRAVQVALARWKFNPGAEGRTYDTEVLFQR